MQNGCLRSTDQPRGLSPEQGAETIVVPAQPGVIDRGAHIAGGLKGSAGCGVSGMPCIGVVCPQLLAEERCEQRVHPEPVAVGVDRDE